MEQEKQKLPFIGLYTGNAEEEVAQQPQAQDSSAGRFESGIDFNQDLSGLVYDSKDEDSALAAEAKKPGNKQSLMKKALAAIAAAAFLSTSLIGYNYTTRPTFKTEQHDGYREISSSQIHYGSNLIGNESYEYAVKHYEPTRQLNGNMPVRDESRQDLCEVSVYAKPMFSLTSSVKSSAQYRDVKCDGKVELILKNESGDVTNPNTPVQEIIRSRDFPEEKGAYKTTFEIADSVTKQAIESNRSSLF